MAKPLTQTISLVDNMTPTLNKVQKQSEIMLTTYNKMDLEINKINKTMDKLIQEGQTSSVMYKQLAKDHRELVFAQREVVKGNQDIINSFNKVDDSIQKVEKTTEKKAGLPSMIAGLVSGAMLVSGTKKLMQFSDSAVATSTRLGMITNDVERLEEQLFQTAQGVGVSYESIADTVASLGMNAGKAFNNSTDEIVEFTDLLNKTFQINKMTASQIQSTMYNMTQSLSAEKLLGPDYKILKQNAPKMIKYLEDYYGVTRAELDEMVSKGEVTAEAFKNAMFASSKDINEQYAKMPISFEAAWTKFMNTLQKILTPVAKALAVVADGMDKFFTFLGQHQYILYIIGATLGVVAAGILTYNTYAAIAALKTALWDTAAGKLALKMMLIVAAVAAVAIALLYLWNTNDDAAYAMLWTWEMVQIGFETVILGLKTAWYGFVSVVYAVASVVLGVVQMIVNGVISGINFIIKGLNLLPGVDIQLIKETTFADDFITKGGENVGKMGDELQDETAKLMDKTRTLNATREQRVQERQKVGIKEMTDGIGKATADALSPLEDIIDTDSTGGKAVKTTTDDKLLSDDDIQLLLDLATRDYKLNYQQVTPNITLTFGDVMQTADVDDILDSITDKLEEIYDSDLEVAASVS